MVTATSYYLETKSNKFYIFKTIRQSLSLLNHIYILHIGTLYWSMNNLFLVVMGHENGKNFPTLTIIAKFSGTRV